MLKAGGRQGERAPQDRKPLTVAGLIAGEGTGAGQPAPAGLLLEKLSKSSGDLSVLFLYLHVNLQLSQNKKWKFLKIQGKEERRIREQPERH